MEWWKIILGLYVIEEQVNTCCAVTMYPEDVVELIDKLKEKLKEYEDRNNSR